MHLIIPLLPDLKLDLQIMTDRLDDRLISLLSAAFDMIEREGVTLTDSAEDGNLVEMYAAYLYRHRDNPSAPMPRMLRWALNNRLLSEKARPDPVPEPDPDPEPEPEQEEDAP